MLPVTHTYPSSPYRVFVLERVIMSNIVRQKKGLYRHVNRGKVYKKIVILELWRVGYLKSTLLQYAEDSVLMFLQCMKGKQKNLKSRNLGSTLLLGRGVPLWIHLSLVPGTGCWDQLERPSSEVTHLGVLLPTVQTMTYLVFPQCRRV